MKNLTILPIFLVTLLAGFSTAPAHADALKGSGVRAELVFLNDPNINGPAQPTNLLTGGTGFHDTLSQVGSGKEYDYDDAVATYSANFNADQLILRVKCDPGISLKKCNAEPGFIWLFKDDVFAESLFSIDFLDSTFLPDSAGSPASDIILIANLLGSAPPAPCGCLELEQKNSKLIIDIAPAPTPEPSSIVLLGTGLLGFAGVVRRRFNA